MLTEARRNAGSQSHVYERDVVQKTVSLLGIEDALAFSEPALLKLFEHEHLEKVWEAQWDPTYPEVKAITFVMPYYEGGSVLRRLTDGHRFSVGQAVKIVSGVLKALAYLHFEERVVHRDIKPGNVFLDRSLQHAFLGDLGCASRLDDAGLTEKAGRNPVISSAGTHHRPLLAGRRHLQRRVGSPRMSQWAPAL